MLSPWLAANDGTITMGSLVIVYEGFGKQKAVTLTAGGQGLTLVHIPAPPEPCLSMEPAEHPNTWDKQCSR